jgi:hypothetical protein
MIWMDYNIEQAGPHFRITGDWDGEVMGKQRDGSPKEHYLYKPGDVFIVNEAGWLVKTDEVNALLLKHENNKTKQSPQPDPNT